MSCATCPHFKHSEKFKYKDMFCYGCSASLSGRTWWTNQEQYFSRYGCSFNGDSEECDNEDVEQFKQMDIFDYLKGAGQ